MRGSTRKAFGSYTVRAPPRPAPPVPVASPAELETKDEILPRLSAIIPQTAILAAAPPPSFAPSEEDSTPSRAVPRIEPFAPEFAYLAEKLPPSTRSQLAERLTRKKYDMGSADPEVKKILEKAVETYAKKRAAGTKAAAARRAREKAEREARSARAAEAAIRDANEAFGVLALDAEPEAEAEPEDL